MGSCVCVELGLDPQRSGKWKAYGSHTMSEWLIVARNVLNWPIGQTTEITARSRWARQALLWGVHKVVEGGGTCGAHLNLCAT